MRDDLLRLPAALAAAARLDNPDLPTAAREADLAVVAESAAAVRDVAAWLDGPAADELAWTLYVHGGLSQDKVAKILGYGAAEGGGRSVRQVQVRLARAQARRLGDVAVVLVAAAGAGQAERITATPPLGSKVDAAAHAAALAELRTAAAADAADGGGSAERTRTALEALAETWGAAAGRLLVALAHAANQALQPPAQGDHQR